MVGEDTIANRVNTFRTLIDNLASMRTNISGNDNAIVLLGSLHDSYEGLVVSINGQSYLTLEGVRSLLLQEETRRKFKGRDIKDKPQALYSNNKPFKGNLKFLKWKFETTNKNPSFQKKKKKRNCFHCDKANHHIKDCRICLQEEKTKSGHQANSVLNT